MSTTITCPNCNAQFEPAEALAQPIREELEKEFNLKRTEQVNVFKLREQQLQQQQEQINAQKQAQELELANKLEQYKKNIQSELSKQLTDKIQSDFENKLRLLEESSKNDQAKLAEWREKELAFLKEKQNLKTREQELELETEKLIEQRRKLVQALKKEEEEKNKLRDEEFNTILKEKENQIQEQKKRAEELNEKEKIIELEGKKLQEQRKIQEQEFAGKLEASKKQMEAELALQIRGAIQIDFENKLRVLEDANKTNESKLTEARAKELEFLKQMQELHAREKEMELEIQRKLMDERAKLSELIKKEEEDKNKLRDAEFQMKLKEKDKQLDDQRKLVEEMQRKAEQGSMQLQGEVQELVLEQLLRTTFPFDIVSEVGKGVKGADCIQTVRNNYGQECGKIIFESKRTKDFSDEWVEKLKADMRALGADVAVIVTKAMPKDLTEGFGEKDGIWICSFADVKPLVHILRELVMKVYSAGKSQENMGDKMALLYKYLVSSEFAEQWRAIREGFLGMKISIQRERDQMEKLWKAREKQLEKVLLNAAHIRGSIEGIAGMDVDLDLLGENNGTYIEVNIV